MSYKDISKTNFALGLQDAFGALRTSQKTSIFDAQHHYGQLHHLFKELKGAPVTSISIGASALVTMPSVHGLTAGMVVVFSNIGGALPTGIVVGTPYFVIATGLTTVAFQFSATLGGAAVTTSGTNTGTSIVSSNTLTCTAAGTVVDSPGNSSLTLGVTTTVGSKVSNRSRRHYYVAGQSHLVAMTFDFQTTQTGIKKRVGYFDRDDGIFLENSGGTVSAIIRTSTSGVPVDTLVAQSAWNLDKMDGTGASGITVDWTKTHIFEMDFQWLGVGTVLLYLNINRQSIPIHAIHNANVLTQVYMQTPHLPCSYEVENISSTVADSMMQVCASVFTEGTIGAPQVIRSISNEFTVVSCALNTPTHVLSIRPSMIFKARENKGMCVPLGISVDVTGANGCHFKVLEDATLTASTFTVHPSTLDSMMEFSRGVASTYTAASGRARDEGFVAGGAGGNPVGSLGTNYQLQIDPSGVYDILTIVAGGIVGAATVIVSITWGEYY